MLQVTETIFKPEHRTVRLRLDPLLPCYLTARCAADSRNREGPVGGEILSFTPR